MIEIKNNGKIDVVIKSCRSYHLWEKPMIILKNGQLTIKIKPYGAELAGISDNRTGREYLWQGEPSIWSGQSPILFPIVGRLCSDSFLYQDKKYYLPKHGFARKSQFEILMASDERASFRLEASEETRRVYPFDFALTVEYALKDKTLAVSSAVKNLGNDEMYFSLGAHPAFNIEIGDFVKFSDYESFTTLLFNESGLMSGEKALAKRRKNIEITEHIFDEDALFFPNLASTSAKIVSKSGRELLKMDFGKVPFVGLWAKPGAPFVCIEPWYGICDSPNVSGKIEEKPYINRLAANEEFRFEYSITVL